MIRSSPPIDTKVLPFRLHTPQIDDDAAGEVALAGEDAVRERRDVAEAGYLNEAEHARRANVFEEITARSEELRAKARELAAYSEQVRVESAQIAGRLAESLGIIAE